MCSVTTGVLLSAIVLGQANPIPKNENLTPFKPLIGKWTGKLEIQEPIPGKAGKGDQAEFTIVYRWSANGQAILLDLSFIFDGQPMSYTNGQIVWDPIAKKIVGTDTYADGGMTTYEFTREGKTLIVKAAGGKADGTPTTATYTFTIVSPDLRTVDVTGRSEGGQSMPDIRGLELKRVPRAKKVVTKPEN